MHTFLILFVLLFNNGYVASLYLFFSVLSQPVVAQYSFFCGNQTMFDQSSLTCTHPDEAVSCQEAEAFYEISNDEFFKIDEGTGISNNWSLE